MQCVWSRAVSDWPLSGADLAMGLTQAFGEDWDWELKAWHQKSWLETLMPQPLAAARQSLSVPDNPLLMAILVATVIVGAQLLPQLLPQLLNLLPPSPPLLSPTARAMLESDEMCGLTTGGQVDICKN